MAYSPSDAVAPVALLQDLLSISLTAVNLLRPLYDSAGELTDFAPEYFNPAAQRMTGLLMERPTGTARTLFPSIFSNGLFAFYRRVFESGEAGHFALNYQADQLDNYFRVAAQRSGELLIVSFTDTADEDRSAVEQALRQSQAAEQAALAEAEQQQALLYRVFEHAPAMICILRGPQHVFQFANAPYRALMGGRPLVGRPFAEALPELAGQGIYEPLDEVYRTGKSYFVSEQPAQIDPADPSSTEPEQRYYNLVWQARRDLAGAIDGVLVFAFDVTGQVLARQQVEQLNADLEARVQQRTQAAEQAQAEAERQRQRVTELVAQSPAAMCVVGGPEFTYEAFNPLYAAMFGGRPQLGRPMGEVLPEVVNHPSFLAFRAVYEQGRTIRENEVLVPLTRPGDGGLEDRYFSYTQQPRYDSQGQIDGVFVFAVEVTDQVHARQQVLALNQALTTTNADLNQSNTQLTRTNVDLDNFIYTASHDLKAPITNIEGLLLALEHELPDDARTGDVPLMLTMMQDAVDRFRRTIDHLTDLSRLQKEFSGASDAVALAPVVDAVRLDLAPLLVHTQGQLTVSIPEGLTVTFAEKNLRSVVYNLLSNAFKYRHSDRQPEVHLRASLTADYAVLEVQDNGLGLDLSQGQERLFAMFQRLHTHVEGTGVGLYMVKRIVENAGGRIEVTSQLGQGSTFQVYFPR